MTSLFNDPFFRQPSSLFRHPSSIFEEFNRMEREMDRLFAGFREPLATIENAQPPAQEQGAGQELQTAPSRENRFRMVPIVVHRDADGDVAMSSADHEHEHGHDEDEDDGDEDESKMEEVPSDHEDEQQVAKPAPRDDRHVSLFSRWPRLPGFQLRKADESADDDDERMVAEVDLGSLPAENVSVQYDPEHHGISVRGEQRSETKNGRSYYSFSSYRSLPENVKLEDDSKAEVTKRGSIVLPLRGRL